MALYKNITTDDNHVLVDKGDKAVINKMLIANKATSGNPCLIKLHLYEPVSPNRTFVLLQTYIPLHTSLIFDDKSLLSFNRREFQLKIETSVAGGDTNIDIIIK